VVRPSAQIDARYHDTPYYLAPRDQVGQEVFAVIRDSMRSKHMVGMGRVMLAPRSASRQLAPLAFVEASLLRFPPLFRARGIEREGSRE
jgi:non-homologous end joining protein Ku